MGVAIPQIITEDRASGALVVDGGLRFDSSKSHNLINNNTRSASSADYTVSVWVKRVSLNSSGLNAILQYETGDTFAFSLTFYADKVYAYDSSGFDADAAYSDGLLRDTSGWYHLHYKRTSGGTGTLYINGVQQSKQTSGTLNLDAFAYNGSIGYRQKDSTRYLGAYLSNLYVIDGQALNPSSFGFTDPLTNTWRPKKYTGTYGTKGFFLPFDGSAPIGQDQSGRGNNWTPVNFGGSNTLEKATGALPILNTDGGGKVARVGVRTDSSASSLVLALPLVGIKSDFSNAVNSGTSNKAITLNNGLAASNASSNFYGGSFYFDGTDDYLTAPDSDDFTLGSGDFTIEFWLNPSATASKGLFGILNSGASTASAAFYSNLTSANKLFFSAGDGSGETNFTSNSAFSTGVWNHAAIVRSGNTINFYFSGALDTTISFTRTIANQSTPFTIGRLGDYTGGGYYNGYIQDFRLYKGVAKYTQNFIPASTDPDILPDTPSGVSYSSNLTQITDGAVAFDGSGDWLSLPTSADFTCSSGTNFTFEAFIYPTSVSDTTPFGIGNNAGFAYRIISGSPYLYIAASGGILNTGTIAANKWTHIAITRNSGTLYSFIDGILVGSVANSGSFDGTQQNFVGAANLTGAGSPGYTFTGQISNAHWVNGTALYTSNFTPPSAPISSVANTKLLCCKSNSSATAFDVSPGTITANGNAAATNFNPFTANINTQRGKQSGWCTWNPLDTAGSTLSNGNLNITTPSSGLGATRGTIGVSSGKWYYEHTIISGATAIGIMKLTDALVSGSGVIGASAGGYSYYSEGVAGGGYTKKINSNTQTDYGASFDPGDTISVAFDLDAGTITFYKNGVSQGVAFSGLSGTFSAAISDGTNAGSIVGASNFGQKPFKFPPPAGFQPLALANTPRPTIVRPDQFVGIVTYYAADAVAGIATGLSFKPDLVWVKSRTSARSNVIVDSVRGTSSVLWTNLTDAQLSSSQYVSQFNSNGFNYGVAGDVTNNSSLVGWCWKAGGNSNTYNINDVGYATASAAGLTGGDVTPTGASVNTKSGFSIITYTGPNDTSAHSFSHGLGKKPSFILIKNRDRAFNWDIYHSSLGYNSSLIFTTAATRSGAYSAEPDSTLINVQWNYTTYQNDKYVAYCWAEIPGFSKFGTYTGNGSATDGPFVFTGMRPRFVLLKRSDSTGNWVIWDSVRNTYNVSNSIILPNTSAAEYSPDAKIDILSNGFKIRDNSSDSNTNGGTFIYAAFAETPTQNLYGAQANAR